MYNVYDLFKSIFVPLLLGNSLIYQFLYFEPQFPDKNIQEYYVCIMYEVEELGKKIICTQSIVNKFSKIVGLDTLVTFMRKKNFGAN